MDGIFKGVRPMDAVLAIALSAVGVFLMLENINARIHFVRRINLETPARRNESFAEHEAITACLLNGDGNGAADLLRRHLALSAEEAASSIREGLARIYAESVA